jgi:enamine deaminase RidA (YjgF/YER057c/UK114 family)
MTYETAGRPTAALVVSGANVVRCADRTATLGRMGTEITRINPEELHPTPGYHHVTVVQAARMVFLAGQCPLDRDGSLVGPGDLEAQLDQVVANVLDALTAVGAHPEDVVRSVIYVVSADVDVLGVAWHHLNRSAIASAFSTASTLLGVAQLGFPGQLIEVELTAALPEVPH